MFGKMHDSEKLNSLKVQQTLYKVKDHTIVQLFTWVIFDKITRDRI